MINDLFLFALLTAYRPARKFQIVDDIDEEKDHARVIGSVAV
jgi:hypothetical protein